MAHVWHACQPPDAKRDSPCPARAGKGIKGWVAPGEDAAALTVHASPAKSGAAAPGAPAGLMSHVGRAPAAAKHSPGAARAAPAPEVKVVVGNKQMLALEGVAVPQAVDEWMREREVRCPWPRSYPSPPSSGGRADEVR